MTTQYQPPPTYADPVLIDKSRQPTDAGYSKFNPIWLKWFLDLTNLINTAGGGSGGGTGGGFDHNLLTNLQGGATGQYYHLTAAEHTEVLDGSPGTLSWLSQQNFGGF